jgi:hypothetical protein
MKRNKIESPSPCRSARIIDTSPSAVSPNPKTKPLQKKKRLEVPSPPCEQPPPLRSRDELPSSWSEELSEGPNLFDNIVPKTDAVVATPRMELFPSKAPAAASLLKSASKYPPSYFRALYYEPLQPDHPIYKKLSKNERPASEPNIFNITTHDFECGPLVTVKNGIAILNNDGTQKFGIIKIIGKEPSKLSMGFLRRLNSRFKQKTRKVSKDQLLDQLYALTKWSEHHPTPPVASYFAESKAATIPPPAPPNELREDDVKDEHMVVVDVVGVTDYPSAHSSKKEKITKMIKEPSSVVATSFAEKFKVSSDNTVASTCFDVAAIVKNALQNIVLDSKMTMFREAEKEWQKGLVMELPQDFDELDNMCATDLVAWARSKGFAISGTLLGARRWFDMCKKDLDNLKKDMGIPSVVAVYPTSATITSNVVSTVAATAVDDEYHDTIGGEYGG